MGTDRLRHEQGTFSMPVSKSLSPLSYAASTWNSIPYSLRCISKPKEFKKELRLLLLYKYNAECDVSNCYVCSED